MKITALKNIVSGNTSIAKDETKEVSDALGKKLVGLGVATEAAESESAAPPKKPAK